MRILHVIHSLDPRSGGPSNSLRGLVQAQAARGHAVQVLATSIQSAEPWEDPQAYEASIVSEECFRHARVQVLPAYGRRRPWSRVGYSPAFGRELRRTFHDQARRPEIVHIHGIFSHPTSLAARRAKQAQIPFVIRPAGGLDPWCLKSKRRRTKDLMLRLLVQRELASAAFLHAMSPAEAAILSNWTDDSQVCCIPHGVEVPSDLETAKQQFAANFPQVQGRRILLFMGRLHSKKRPELMIEALHRFHLEFPDLIVVFAGSDDGHAETLRQMVRERGLEDRVVFTGFLGGMLKSGALATADVFGLPSLDENFGLSVIEAMAHGAATVVTCGVGAHEHVDRAGCGRTVGESAEEFVEGVGSLLQSDARSIGQRGASYVAANLSWESVAGQIDQLYSRCLVSSMEPMISPGRPIEAGL